MQEVQETWVRPLGWEDTLEREMATYSSILAWKIPCTEEPGGPQSMGLLRHGRARTHSNTVDGTSILLQQILP